MKPTKKACWLTDGMRHARAASGAALRALLLAASLAAGALACHAGPVHLVLAEVRGEPGAAWEMPASPPFADDEARNASGGAPAWQPVTLPHARPRSLAARGDTVGAAPEVEWYRISVPQAQRATAGELFLYLPRWQTIGNVAVYADGHLVHRSRGSRVWNSFNRPLWVNLSAGAQKAPPAYVMVRMASQRGVGGAVSSAWIGTEDDLQWRWQLREWVQADLINLASASFFVIGLFSLAVWCVRREAIYGLFFAASVTHVLRAAHYTLGDRAPLIPDAWFGWITVNSLAWAMAFIFAFAFRVHRQRMPRLEKLVAALVVLTSVATLPVPLVLPHLDAILPLVYIAITALTAIVAASGLWASWVSGSREGLVLSAWLSLNVPAGVHDLLLVGYRINIEHIYIAPYVSIGLFTIFMVIVYRRYVGAIAEVETLNTGLESRLAAREQELAASYGQLRELERQRTLGAERQRMMQDMHDGIGSSLMSALRMVQLGELRSGDMAQVLKECIDDLKLSIDSLEPADTDLLGLLAMLRFRLAPRLQAAGIRLTWSVRDVPPLDWLDPPSALHILRILQEVLTNITKHGNATVIDIATSHDAEQATVAVRDNSAPIALPLPQSAPGRGLANIRSRSLALGAHCDWRTGEGGNEFRLSLPFAKAPAGEADEATG